MLIVKFPFAVVVPSVVAPSLSVTVIFVPSRSIESPYVEVAVSSVIELPLALNVAPPVPTVITLESVISPDDVTLKRFVAMVKARFVALFSRTSTSVPKSDNDPKLFDPIVKSIVAVPLSAVNVARPPTLKLPLLEIAPADITSSVDVAVVFPRSVPPAVSVTVTVVPFRINVPPKAPVTLIADPLEVSVVSPSTVNPDPVISPLDVTFKKPVASVAASRVVGPTSLTVISLPIRDKFPNEFPDDFRIMFATGLVVIDVLPETISFPDWAMAPSCVMIKPPEMLVVTNVSVVSSEVVEVTVASAVFNCNFSTLPRLIARAEVIPVTLSESPVPSSALKMMVSMSVASFVPVTPSSRVVNLPPTKISVNVAPALTETTSLEGPLVLVKVSVPAANDTETAAGTTRRSSDSIGCPFFQLVRNEVRRRREIRRDPETRASRVSQTERDHSDFDMFSNS